MDSGILFCPRHTSHSNGDCRACPWPGGGALLFGAVGVLYLVTQLRHPDWILMIIALLFLINWLKRAELGH
jgi:hypothetical protein